MSWAIEEYVEDAIVAFLNSKLPSGELAVYTAWTDQEIKYPCAVVHAGQADNVTGQFTGHRRIDATIAVMSEAVAVGTQSARNTNRTHRNAIMEALAQTGLHDDINALTPAGVVFSRAQIGPTTRAVVPERRAFVSEITLQCIASPKAL